MLGLHMFVSTHLRSKKFGTDIAHKTQTLVPIHVFLIVAFSIEPFPTLLTVETELPRVKLHVLSQAATRGETFKAFTTWKWFAH